MGTGDWAAQTGVAGHEWTLVVAPSDSKVDAQRLADGWPGARVLGLDEPAHQRLGNLGGTVRAWRWLRDRVSPATQDRVLILHDAGAASRSQDWTAGCGGRRGWLPLPGRHGPHPMRLLEAVARLSSPLGASNPGGFVDVVWTSQLLLPAAGPTTLAAPTHDLTKLTWRWSGEVPDAAAAELGWFAIHGSAAVDFAPAGTFPDAVALSRWPHPDRRADCGSFRVRRTLLDRLADLDLTGQLDLDPGLTGPILSGRPDRLVPPLRQHVHHHGSPSVGVHVLPHGSLWLRMRRRHEVLAAVSALDSPALRRALAITGTFNPEEWVPR